MHVLHSSRAAPGQTFFPVISTATFQQRVFSAHRQIPKGFWATADPKGSEQCHEEADVPVVVR